MPGSATPVRYGLMTIARPSLDLSGRVALVTGAGAHGGIGHASACALAEVGAIVFAADLDGDAAQDTANEIVAAGGTAAATACDAGSPDQILRLFERLDRTFPQGIDILVNNVGLGFRARPEQLELSDWQQVLRINLDGTFLCSREAGRRMLGQGRGGAIVSISSIAGSSALGRGNFVYSVTKGGINQLTRELAIEWGHAGIRVNAIQPAQTLTPGVKAGMLHDPRLDPATFQERLVRGIPLNRLGEPEDIAAAVVFLASDAAAFITGHILPVDGGNLALNAGGSKTWDAESVG
jgi:NAD(P)-dependent dehydrogenase (short-subunit alcohol dehydrogenase family)